ncbi:MAG: PQQ-binding-like beta-propeller repeat protein [Planctomycetota bacterium]
MPLSPRVLGLSTALFGVLSCPAQEAGPWPRFRGPNGSGIAETRGLPERFDGEDARHWRTPLPSGHSSPVLSRTAVFLTAEDDGALFTYALSRQSGEVLWRSRAPRPRVGKRDGRNHAAAATPVVGAGVVIVFFADYGMLAYDHDGLELWRLPLGPFDNVYGMGASPILLDDRVYLACDQSTGSFLLAADAKTGRELWRTPRPTARSGHCTPIVIPDDAGAPQLVLPGSFYLDGYDPGTGERLWWVGGLSFEMKSVPAWHDGKIYINGYGSPLNQPGQQVDVPGFDETVEQHDADGDGAIGKEEMPPSRARGFFEFVDLEGDGTLGRADWDFLRASLASQNGMLAIEPGGRGDRTEEALVWAYRRSVPQLPSPLVYGDVLYMLNDQGGILVTLDPKTGDVRERGRLKEAIDSYYASPVAGDGKVYFVSEGGIVSVLPAGGSLEPLAVHDFGESCYATPALADGCLYLRSVDALYCFSGRDG